MAIAGLVETTTGVAVDADTRYPLTTSNVLLTSDERAGLSLVAITESNPPVTAATRQTPTVELGEGTALVIPAEHASYRAAITADAATLTLTPPASGSVEITALVRSRTVGQAALSIDTEDAFFGVSLDADTYARTAYLLIGGADVEGELTLALSDDSAADVVIPLTCVGTEWRRVAVSYRAGAAAQTLDITWAQTSATGALYWQSVAVEGPAPDTGSALLTAALQAAPSRVDLTATGRTDWALWGRTDASTIDRKAGVTAQIGTLGVTGDTAARVASAGSTWAFEDAAPAVSQELTLAGVTPYWGCGGTPVDLIPAGGHVRIWAEVFADGTASVDASAYLPSIAVSAPPALTSITLSPSQAQVASGLTQQFTASGWDQYGEAFALTGGTWAVSGGGSISTSGLFTASAVGGPYTVSYTEAGYLGAAIQGTASVTISAASGTGLLQASYSIVPDSTVVNLTAEGPDDWAHFGLADADDRNEQDGSTLIGTVSRLGDGTSGRWYGAGVQPKWSWSDGSPTASEAGTYGYWDITLGTADAGDGWSGSIAADTNEHVATFWVRTYQTTGVLNLSLSDDADEPLAIALGDLSATKYYEVPVTYRADSAAQTLDWEWVQTADPGNIALAAIAVTVGSDPIELTSIDWTPDSITMDEGAQATAAAVALDQYGRPMVGTSLDLSVGAGVTATPDPVTSGSQVTITAGAAAVGSYTLAAATGGVTGNLPITVEDYVAPTEFPAIAWRQQYIDEAMALPLLKVGDATQSYGQANTGLPYLAMVARNDPSATASNGALVAARIAEQITYMLSADGQPINEGIYPRYGPNGVHDDWNKYHVAVCLTLATHTPAVWERLSTDTIGRADWYMRLCAYVANLSGNAAHDILNTGREIPHGVLNWRSTGTSANQRIWPFYHGLTKMYFGDNHDAQLANYNATATVSAIESNGWIKWRYPFNDAAFQAAASYGTTWPGGSGLGTAYYASTGVRAPATSYYGRYSTDYVGAPQISAPFAVRSSPVLITPRNIVEYEIQDFNFCRYIVDTPCGSADTTGQPGHMKAGYGPSPHLGLMGMPHEYWNNTRSSPAYVASGVRIHMYYLATCMLLGHFPSNAANDAILARIRRGIDVLQYRARNVCWWENEIVNQGYSPGNYEWVPSYTPNNFSGMWQGSVDDLVIKPSHTWPDDPV